MSDDTPHINNQVLEAVNASNLLVLGSAQGSAQALAYESMAHSITLLMQNNAAGAFGGKQIEVASVASTCARILAAGQ